MKKLIRHITVASLVSIVLVASMGFSVNTLYCLCVGQFEASLFSIEHHCPKNHETEVQPEHACCKKLSACHLNKKQKSPDCSHKSVKYVKADLKFTPFEKEVLPEWDFVALQNTWEKLPFVYTFDNAPLLISEMPTRPPPQYYGRKLLNFVQVYRC